MTDRTCRKAGVYCKEVREQGGQTPAQIEYDRAYNRLKQRKNRKKITLDEWNAAMIRAQELLEQSSQEKLTDEKLKQKMSER